MDPAPALKVCPGDRHLAGHLPFPRQELAHGPGEEFGDSVADVRAGDQEHPVPKATLRQEMGFESGDFGEGERTSRHAA